MSSSAKADVVDDPKLDELDEADLQMSADAEAEAEARRERSSASSSELGVVRHASLGRRAPDARQEQGRLVRVKSVGSAPRRAVSAARRVVRERESIRVEFGHVAAPRGSAVGTGVDGEPEVGSAM